MAHLVLEQSFDPPLDDDERERIARRVEPCLEQYGVRWIRTCFATDRRRMTCEFEAPDAETLRTVCRSAGVRYDRLWAAEVRAPQPEEVREAPTPPLYSPAARALQDRFDTRRLADRLAEVKVHDRFTAEDRAFLERLDMFFLATVDAAGRPTCSYKGGDPGLVTVVDDRTLAFPSYDGNGMYLSMGNVDETRRVGLLFVDFERQRRMRVDGTAELRHDDPLLAAHPAAQLVVRVHAERIYPNCPRYVHKYQLVERSAFVPRAGISTPVPGWKQSEWARDVLPAGDPARAPR